MYIVYVHRCCFNLSFNLICKSHGCKPRASIQKQPISLVRSVKHQSVVLLWCFAATCVLCCNLCALQRPPTKRAFERLQTHTGSDDMRDQKVSTLKFYTYIYIYIYVCITNACIYCKCACKTFLFSYLSFYMCIYLFTYTHILIYKSIDIHLQ